MSRFSISLVPAPKTFAATLLAPAASQAPASAAAAPQPSAAGPGPRPTLTLATAAPRKTCAFGANCNCVFSSNQPSPAELGADLEGVVDPAVATEVSTLTYWGYRVVEASTDAVFLERRRSIPFCFNLGLTVVTGSLWLLYWLPRSRRPRIDRCRVSRSLDGLVTTTRETKSARPTPPTRVAAQS